MLLLLVFDRYPRTYRLFVQQFLRNHKTCTHTPCLPKIMQKKNIPKYLSECKLRKAQNLRIINELPYYFVYKNIYSICSKLIFYFPFFLFVVFVFGCLAIYTFQRCLFICLATQKNFFLFGL